MPHLFRTSRTSGTHRNERQGLRARAYSSCSSKVLASSEVFTKMTSRPDNMPHPAVCVGKCLLEHIPGENTAEEPVESNGTCSKKQTSWLLCVANPRVCK